MFGHRAEKCRKLGGGYDENVVKKFETNLRGAKKIRELLNTYMDTKRKEEKDYYQTREIELQKELPHKTSLMIGRTEIPKWVGQDFDVWKKELEKWTENDKSLEETKHCHMLESLRRMIK